MRLRTCTNFLILIFLLIITNLSFAQSDSTHAVTMSANVDLVSRYIWRGQDYGNTPSIQPGVSTSWKKFTLGVWGAYNFTGNGEQETDMYVSKTIGPVTVSVWDYWMYNDTIANDVFDYKKSSTGHQLEGQILWSGGEKIPFNVLGSYFFYGSDASKSIYIELQYLKTIGSFDMMFFAGFQPKGDYYAQKAGFVNLGCNVTKCIPITASWDLPLNISFIVNPSAQRAYVVAGITF